MKFIQINLQHKKRATDLLLAELTNLDIHIAIIQEPYVSKSTNKIPSIPKGYIQYHNGFSSMSAIIIRKSISHFLLSEFTTNNMTSIVVSTKEAGKVVVISMYCPQSQPPLSEEWRNVQTKIKHLGAQSIVGADANCHSTQVGYKSNDKRADEWEPFLIAHDLLIHNEPNVKTFRNSRGHQSTIDWTITTPTLNARLQNWHVPEDHESLSDHKAIFFNLDEDPIPIDSKKRNFMKTDWSAFRSRLQEHMSSYPTADNSTEAIKSFSEALTKTIEETVPKTGKTTYKNNWWNKSLQETKSALRKEKRKGINEHYKELKQKFEQEIASAKQTAWESFTSSVESRDDAYIRYKILCKPREDSTLPSLKVNDKWTNSTTESANELLKSNLPDLPRPLPQKHANIEKEVENYLKTPETQNIQQEPKITEAEVRKSINEQKIGRAPGTDEIPGIVYKQTLEIITPSLTKIFNMLLTEGEFPAEWASAKIIFIKKPNKPNHDPTAYRPISLLPTVGKLYEKVILHRLNWHTRKNQLIDSNQFGFQKGVSAEQAGLNLANTISTAFKARKEVGAVFCDISKAFPSIWHAGLIKKMIENKIPIEYIRFMNSYLAKQTAVVNISEGHRIQKSLTRACPQGSCISPWAWNLVLNDLFPKIRDTGANMQAFADDIVIYIVKNKTQSLTDTLSPAMRVLEEWGQKWLIKFCPEKTKCMTFSWLKKAGDDSIILDNRELENVTTYKYLGLTFDRRLTWKAHLTNITAKSSRLLCKLSPICKSRWGLQSETIKFIYERAILPIIFYGAIVWCKILDQASVQKNLQKVQRLAALNITGGAKTTANDTLNILAGLKPLHIAVAERAAMQLHNIYANPDLKKRLDIDKFLTQHEQKRQHESSLQKANTLLNEALPNKNCITELTKLTNLDHPGKTYNPDIIIGDDPEETPIENLILYTDASKSGENSPVGVAVVVKKVQVFETIFDCSLPPNASVFDGELRAIEEAVRYANETSEEHHSIRIRSDSLSSLLAIQDTSNRDKRIFTLHKVIQNMLHTRNIKVKFEWVRAHVGLEGNEAADEAAKLATRKNYEPGCNSITKNQIKRNLKQIAMNKWQLEWNTSHTGRFTHELFPQVSIGTKFLNLPNRTSQKLLFKAASGHFPSNDYLTRFKIKNDEKCPNCHFQDSIDHILTKCNRFASMRHYHVIGLQQPRPELNILNMLTNDKLQQLTINILKLRSKEFDETIQPQSQTLQEFLRGHQ